MENVLGLIPARGGSKGIPRKNIAPVAGRPLLAYTCEAALASRVLDRVVLSTDDPEIAEVGCCCGVEVPFIRPGHLARDETPSVAVAEHAIEQLTNKAWRPDVVVLLQPTSPLRTTQHIDEAVERMREARADTIVSVVEVPHCFHPQSIMRFRDGGLVDFLATAPDCDRYRRQNNPVLYARNGPAVLASSVDVILGTHSFYGPHVVPYFMGEEDSLDIDSMFDLWLAGQLIRRREDTRRCAESQA
jgi:CMP-N-acetylneuraminic acid synthetase